MRPQAQEDKQKRGGEIPQFNKYVFSFQSKSAAGKLIWGLNPVMTNQVKKLWPPIVENKANTPILN